MLCRERLAPYPGLRMSVVGLHKQRVAGGLSLNDRVRSSTETGTACTLAKARGTHRKINETIWFHAIKKHDFFVTLHPGENTERLISTNAISGNNYQIYAEHVYVILLAII